MTTERFNVVLQGGTLRGQDIATVAAELARLIKRDVDLALRLLRGQPTQLKSGVDAATGARYIEALERIGAAARLEPETLEVDADIAKPQRVSHEDLHPKRASTPAANAEARTSPRDDSFLPSGRVNVAQDSGASEQAPRIGRLASLPNLLFFILLAMAVWMGAPKGQSVLGSIARTVGFATAICGVPLVLGLVWNTTRGESRVFKWLYVGSTILCVVVLFLAQHQTIYELTHRADGRLPTPVATAAPRSHEDCTNPFAELIPGCPQYKLTPAAPAAPSNPFADPDFGKTPEPRSTNQVATDPDPNDAVAQFNLGEKYLYGEGVPQDYTEAAKWYRKAADQGNADAQTMLGILLAGGLGVPKDYAEATKWLRRAADQGSAQAQYVLGRMYNSGDGVPRDYAEAMKWYQKAAYQGSAEAQFGLGCLYYLGQGVPQNYALAAAWLRKAADQGFAQAQDLLGSSYALGLGLPQDYVEAMKWFNLAASRFPVSQAAARNETIKSRDIVANVATPAQIAEAERRASEWKPR